MAISRLNRQLLQPRPGNYGIRPENARPMRTPHLLVATTYRFRKWKKPSFSLCSNHVSDLSLTRLSRHFRETIVSFRENSQYSSIKIKQHCTSVSNFINPKKLLFVHNQFWYGCRRSAAPKTMAIDSSRRETAPNPMALRPEDYGDTPDTMALSPENYGISPRKIWRFSPQTRTHRGFAACKRF